LHFFHPWMVRYIYRVPQQYRHVSILQAIDNKVMFTLK
jgi:hypothetical protein